MLQDTNYMHKVDYQNVQVPYVFLNHQKMQMQRYINDIDEVSDLDV